MNKCPYTWVKSFFSGSKPVEGVASQLRVTVTRDRVTTVDVTLPAGSARWLIDLIPEDVITKIKAEGIPIVAIQEDLAQSKELVPQKIFVLDEPERSVAVWLE